MSAIVVRGARQHNLKNLTVSIPRHKFVVITGPSGSGKSSLAFDTIYAEGQRRYVESLSAYARQFLGQLAKPNIESIDGLSPAIAIEQRALAKSSRSTVGTVTEIADYLRLLFARVGTPHCPNCKRPIQAQTVQQIVDRILAFAPGSKVVIMSPIARARKSELRLELDQLRRDGFVRARIDGKLVDLGDEIVLDGRKPHDLDVVIDRVVLRDAAPRGPEDTSAGSLKGRVTDSVELALKLGDGRLLVDPSGGTDAEPITMSERFACTDCGISLPPIEPRMFSFNGPHGACKTCDGIGSRTRVDADRVVPDPKRTLREGAVLAWGKRGSVALALEIDAAVKALGVPADVPWAELSENDRQLILYGAGDQSDATDAKGKARRRRGEYAGVIPRLEALLESGDTIARDEEDEPDEGEPDDVGRFVVTRLCEACGGKRLRPEALAVLLSGRNIADVGRLPLSELREMLRSLAQGEDGTLGSAFGPRQRAIAEPLLRSVIARLGFLIDVGLDYLTLDRAAMTLSGGEGQRIRLATQIGAALVGVLYVLDEPSVGLHARDNTRLIDALRALVELGNSVLVVEHDREAILAADHVIDMGPGAGEHGGQIVCAGPPAKLIGDPASVTGPYLARRSLLRAHGAEGGRRRKPNDWIQMRGARANNLANLDVAFPTGVLTAVTGVSGSGKSSLITDTLLPAIRRALYHAHTPVGEVDAIEGLEQFDKVVSMDQSFIGRTPRSNPATYTGVFALLRELFAGLPESRARGYKSGRFSFNVKGGRCEACLGDGVLRVEMHFLPDVFVQCETCAGRRYNRETLEVLYRGRSIADVLELTVDEALVELEAVPRVRELLAALSKVGLGYVRLGQPATTLSGGEAQRVKLARELARRATGKTLYVLDEPTTGLHFQDVELLLIALHGLCDAGNTVIVIEHNLDLIASADWVVDLGPEGGARGGNLIATGTPEQVGAVAGSHTGRYLREALDRRSTDDIDANVRPLVDANVRPSVDANVRPSVEAARDEGSSAKLRAKAVEKSASKSPDKARAKHTSAAPTKSSTPSPSPKKPARRGAH